MRQFALAAFATFLLASAQPAFSASYSLSQDSTLLASSAGEPAAPTSARAASASSTPEARASTTSSTNSNEPNAQAKIPLLEVITGIPMTSLDTLEYSFQKDRIPAWATILATTAILYQYDQDIYDGITRDGRRWNIGNHDGTTTIVSGFGLNLVRVPTDLGSSLYYLGDGWTHSLIAVGFFGTGYFTENNRAYNTGVELVHGLITSTLFSQVLKRSFGREDPGESTMTRGRWRPFPSIHAYGQNTAQYDAFPSGHEMTATLTFTIIEQNYPEYFNYIFPVQVVWQTLLGFEMVNNGVHWASDYPLGIAMGYVIGKMSARLGHPERDPLKKQETASWSFYPSVTSDGTRMNALYSF